MLELKPLSKAEQVYFNQIKKRPSYALFHEVRSKTQEASQQIKHKMEKVNDTL